MFVFEFIISHTMAALRRPTKDLCSLSYMYIHIYIYALSPALSASAGPADFETILTADISGALTRVQRVERVCGWLCSEALLHEHSEQVAASIQVAVQTGTVQPAAAGLLLPLLGRDTSPMLRLHVQHELVHEDVCLALGSLAVAVPGGSVASMVPALLIQVSAGDLVFRVSAQLSPLPRAGMYSECHHQLGAECAAVRVGAVGALAHASASATTPQGALGSAPTARSHRSHRLRCQEAHRSDMRLTGVVPAELPDTVQEVLSRKVSVLSTASENGCEHVHTVFFR